jgi:hypothetical protein
VLAKEGAEGFYGLAVRGLVVGEVRPEVDLEEAV